MNDLRDQFALAAMQKYLEAHDMAFLLYGAEFKASDMMQWCYAIADAAMAAREKASG